ncbi:MAG TPA: EthD family reductase [Terriglobia bacterium]|nr:EthD family reductase [Terriglobia bacterium]
MIKVSVMYPNQEGARFDMMYYLNIHFPLVRQKLGAALKRVEVEQGLGGGAPGSPAPYLALGHLSFESVEAFQTAFAPHAQALMADIPNYTNTQPTIQISEVKI